MGALRCCSLIMTNFNSCLLTSVIEAMRTHQSFSAPYNPSTNDTLERANSTLVSIMRKLAHSDAANWDLYLPASLFAYHLSKHHVTGFSPFAMIYSREATTPSVLGFPLIEHNSSGNPEQTVKDLVNHVIDIQASAYCTSYKTKSLELTPSNSSQTVIPEFQAGDQVLYHQN